MKYVMHCKLYEHSAKHTKQRIQIRNDYPLNYGSISAHPECVWESEHLWFSAIQKITEEIWNYNAVNKPGNT